VLPYLPALHGAVHATVTMPGVAPYNPEAHGVHAPDPATLCLPAAHISAEAFVEPSGHAYPALQLPEQADEVRAGAAPNSPAGQGAVQAEDASPGVLP
jgi:hypothetical protein